MIFIIYDIKFYIFQFKAKTTECCWETRKSNNLNFLQVGGTMLLIFQIVMFMSIITIWDKYFRSLHCHFMLISDWSPPWSRILLVSWSSKIRFLTNHSSDELIVISKSYVITSSEIFFLEVSNYQIWIGSNL